MTASISKSGDGLCAFCYKNASSFCCDNNFDKEGGTVNLVDRFLNTLERFCNSDESHNNVLERITDLSWSKYLGCCENCVGVLKTFCAEYDQLKILELRVLGNLEQLMEVMQVAGRMPLREKNLRKLFQGSPGGAGNCDEGQDEECLESFKVFRLKIMKNCTTRLGTSNERLTPRRLLKPNIDACHNVPCNSSSGLVDTMSDMEIQGPEIQGPEIQGPEIMHEIANDDGRLLEDHVSSSMINAPIVNEPMSGNNSEDEMKPTIKYEDNQNTDLQDPSTLAQNAEEFILPVCIKTEVTFDESNEATETTEQEDEISASHHFVLKVEANPDNDYLTEDISTSNEDDAVCTSSRDSIISDVDPKVNKISAVTSTSLTFTQKDITKANDLLKNFEKCDKKKVRLPLERPLKLHDLLSKNKCPECGKGFKRKDHMNRHLETHKDPSTWKFQCHHCSRKFSAKYILTQHTRAFHNYNRREPINYRCNICSKTFLTNLNLKMHQKRVHGEVNQDTQTEERL